MSTGEDEICASHLYENKPSATRPNEAEPRKTGSSPVVPAIQISTSTMTAFFTTQIELDDRGVAWIAGTKVKVAQVVLDKIAYGSSPEEIHFQHPNLTLAQIYGAMTYYYENQDKVDEQIRRGLEESERLSQQLSDPGFRQRLAELKRDL